jgi:hypothetical protein
MSLKNIEAKATDKINRQEAATLIKGQNLAKLNDEEAPRFYVFKLELEENVEIFLSGSKPLIPLQASLVKAFDDLLKVRIDADWSAKEFWQWVRNFENGFLEFTVGARKDFLKRIKQKRPWDLEYEKRPQVLEVKKPEKSVKSKKEKILYKTVLLYPDRTESQDILFTGTYKEIANSIINWWNLRSEKNKLPEQSERNNDVQMLSGHPKVYCYFEEDRRKDGSRPRRGRFCFRLMNYKDDTISIADLKKIGGKIKEVFGKPPGYLWTKGKRYANYNHWELGYKLQLLSPSAATGEKLIRDILKIQGHEFNKARMTYSQNQGEKEAFPSEPTKKRILGEDVELPTRRPDCKVRFRYATVELGSLKHNIVLFSRDKNNPIDSRLRD